MKKSGLYYGTLLLCILSFSQQALSQTLTLTPSNYNGFNISCAGFADGSINMTITGGTPPYTIRWSNNMITEDISGLQAGYYMVEVNDADTLTGIVTVDITLREPEPLNIIELLPYRYQNGYNVSQYGACNGSVTANVTGGVTPYSYIWQPGNQTIYNPTNLCGNDNQISVTDNNGCIIASGIGLSEPDRDDWTMSGNYNSNPANQFIGTLDSKDLSFRTNNLERLRILSNGSIQINSLAGSGGILHVDSTGKIVKAPCYAWSTCGNNLLANDFLGSMNASDVTFKSSGIERFRLKHNGPIFFKDFESQPLALLHTIGGDLFTIDMPNDPSLFLNSQGQFINLPAGSFAWTQGSGVVHNISDNIGLGTNSPLYKLHVKHDPGAQSNGILIESTSASNSNTEIKFAWNGDDQWAIGNSVAHNGDRNFFIYDNQANTGWGATRFYINDEGRVGIGVIPPSGSLPPNSHYKLYVDGGIMTRDVKVTAQTPFPDYVFESNYKLLSIDELKEFVAINKHLPGIPAADTVKEEDGFEVGKLQLKLLEKLEEQTLYIFNLQQQINELRAQMENK
jgi:hypothetical protein